MGYTRIAAYTGIVIGSFFLGRCSQSGAYRVVQDHKHWYLHTPDARLPIHGDQVGDLRHRLEGIVREDPRMLEKELTTMLNEHMTQNHKNAYHSKR